MTRSIVAGAVVCALALAARDGRAQQSPDLVTDRPDQTASAVSVPRGSVQVELGAVARQLGQRTSLGGNVGYQLGSIDRLEGGRRALGRWIYSGALGFDIALRWDAFIEVFGNLPGSEPGPAVHALDGGVTCLLKPRLQLDLSVGMGLNDRAPDRFVGLGLSFRVPR